MVLNGGRYPFDDRKGIRQRAIIDFVCDPDRTGLEGMGEPEDKSEVEERELRARAEDEDDEDKGDEEEPEDPASLRFISYRQEEDKDDTVGILRLEWKTKYACEGQTEHESRPKGSAHWGFFTWLFIVYVGPQ